MTLQIERSRRDSVVQNLSFPIEVRDSSLMLSIGECGILLSNKASVGAAKRVLRC